MEKPSCLVGPQNIGIGGRGRITAAQQSPRAQRDKAANRASSSKDHFILPRVDWQPVRLAPSAGIDG